MNSFISELEELLNKYNKGNESNTADYILAQYLSSCLDAFIIANNSRTANIKFNKHI